MLEARSTASTKPELDSCFICCNRPDQTRNTKFYLGVLKDVKLSKQDCYQENEEGNKILHFDTQKRTIVKAKRKMGWHCKLLV
eukprot:3798033-Ditylum_brightwellii.AAC.1